MQWVSPERSAHMLPWSILFKWSCYMATRFLLRSLYGSHLLDECIGAAHFHILQGALNLLILYGSHLLEQRIGAAHFQLVPRALQALEEAGVARRHVGAELVDVGCGGGRGVNEGW